MIRFADDTKAPTKDYPKVDSFGPFPLNDQEV